MQRFARTVFSVLAVAGCLGGFTDTSAAQGGPEQELIQLERDWCNATMKKDAATLSRILADDHTGVTSRGVAQTKADILTDLKDQRNATDSCEESSMKVRLYGDAAVVTGLATRTGTNKGVAFSNRQVLWTDTFVKKDGRWQCVASQGTVIAAQQK